MTIYRTYCFEDHTNAPPELGLPHVGTSAGWEAYAIFKADGWYGVDQSVRDSINALNSSYQGDYADLADEYAEIKTSLSDTHIVGGTCACGDSHADMDDMDAWIAVKVARLNEINCEIDELFMILARACRDLVGDSAYEAYLTAHGKV